MIHLDADDVVAMHADVLAHSGGGAGIRDRNGLESAVAQPQTSFGGADLYPTLIEKASALCYSLVLDHPFVDGNKRIGVVAMVAFLDVNGYDFRVDADSGEATILRLAAGDLNRDELADWVRSHAEQRPD